ncbi:alpha-ketoglutarate-dependent dioxygenase AlkB family protein [Larsenimonas rhizosphaerae]|uniref:Alpha-ketoglutarate-dependent dioxygenase AlkB n=1 Tax=Larsenimonas rhizosphaerae TaxID=2944682 RepID=A0AA41ZGE9_9GAMM|nr:alpha-ketoglutarate-dependent dioxygenase AlkB [Larsenimonas rhizosphaerae]MCX2523428.1 alpha-ketoglutarate-dependent dioxygenase AlkB [Larsenimonas rhizosphaerae]
MTSHRVLEDWPLWYLPDALDGTRAWQVFEELLALPLWEQPDITLFGKRHPIPRQQIWMGDPDAAYRYSNQQFIPVAWHPTVASLRDGMIQLARQLLPDAPAFNSVLLNHYENGQHRMGWHSDNEPELGSKPVIASLSLGATRDFRLRRADPACRTLTPSFNIPLEHGSVLLMGPGVQTDWQHSLPPRQRHQSPRINLTFRHVFR